jgi:hypothetical protein
MLYADTIFPEKLEFAKHVCVKWGSTTIRHVVYYDDETIC